MDKNLDKELGQILSRVFLLQSHLSKFPRRTWTRNLDNCWLPCYCLRGPRREGPPGIGALLFFLTRQPEEENIRDSPPGEEPELGQELGQGTWIIFITCFPLAEPLVQVPPRRVIRIIRIIRSYGGGLALRVRNWSLHPGAPPALHRSLSLLKFSSFIADRCRATCPA